MSKLQILNPGVRRLAKAEIKRNRGRTALIFVLVTVAATLGLLMALFTRGGNDHAMGISGNDSALVDQLLERVEPESYELWHWQFVRGLQVVDRSILPSGAPDVLDDLLTGPDQAYYLIEGVAAVEVSDVVVSDATAEWLALDVGDPLTVGEQELSVVGIAQGIGDSEQVAFLAPGSMTDGEIRGNAWFASQERVEELSQSDEITMPPVEGVPRAQLYTNFTQDGNEAPVGSVIVTIMTMMVAGTLSAAAWTTGFNRRLSQAALASVVGAEPRHLRVGVAVQAIWISLAAVLTSWILVAMLWAGSVSLAEGSRPRLTGWTIAAIALNTIIVLAVSVFAAWLPVAQLGSASVSAGLASRVEYRAPSIRSALEGIGLLMIGFAFLQGTVGGGALRLMGLGLLGAGCLVAGATLAMPWLIDRLMGLATSRSAAGRLAIRGLNTHRHRSVGLTLVIGAVVALATAGLIDNAGGQRRSQLHLGQPRANDILVQFGHPDPDQDARIVDALEALDPIAIMELSDPSGYAPVGEMLFDQDRAEQIQALDMAGILIEDNGSFARSDDSTLILELSAGFLAVILLLLGFLQRSEDSERRSALYGLGSPPSMFRRTAGWSGLLTGGIATAVGMPLGLLVHLAVESETPRFVVPWLDLAILLVGVPVSAGAIAVTTTPGPKRSRSQWQQDHVALAS